MASTPVTATRRNDAAYTPTAMSAAVAFTPTTTTTTVNIPEDEANCKQKFHEMNAAGGVITADFTAAESTLTPLNANVAKIGTNTTAIQSSMTTINAERIVNAIANIKANSHIVGGLPAGYVVEFIVFQTTTDSGDSTITVGFTESASEILGASNIQGAASGDIAMADAIGAGTPYLPLVDHLPSVAARDLYFTESGGGWNGTATYTIFIGLKKVLY